MKLWVAICWLIFCIPVLALLGYIFLGPIGAFLPLAIAAWAFWGVFEGNRKSVEEIYREASIRQSEHATRDAQLAAEEKLLEREEAKLDSAEADQVFGNGFEPIDLDKIQRHLN